MDDAESFIMFSGGEVSNLVANLARVDFSPSLASCLGMDIIGNLIKNELMSAGVNLSILQTSLEYPTTLVKVTLSIGTPDFCVYWGADQELIINDSLFKVAKKSKTIHISAFALSRDPSRSTILTVLRANQPSGKLLTFDPNYHPNIWLDNHNYLSILKDVTGAGDAFWTGVYTGFLNDFSALESAKLGQTIAEYKIGILGPIKDHLPLEKYIAQAQKRDYSIIY